MSEKKASPVAAVLSLAAAISLLAAVLMAYFHSHPGAEALAEWLASGGSLALPGTDPVGDAPLSLSAHASTSTRGETALITGSASPATAFSGRLAYHHVVALAQDVGARPAGTLESVRAGEYVESQLKEMGYTTSEQRFPLRYYQNLSSSLRIISPSSEAVAAQAAVYSTPGHVKGPLTSVGLGLQQDLTGLDLSGKIALVRTGDIPLDEKVANVTTAGAQGVVIWDDQPGSYYAVLSETSRIPVISVKSESGEHLHKLLEQGPVEVEMTVDSITEDRLARNIVATKKRGAEPNLLVMAHLDSLPVGVGANDNASGVAIMLELARLLSGESRAESVVFVVLGASEYSSLGAQTYLNSLPEDLRGRLGLAIELDSLGAGGPLLTGSPGNKADWAVSLAQQIANAYSIPLERYSPGSDGDHFPFASAGIPTLIVRRASALDYLPQEDVLTAIERPKLDEAGRFVELLLKQALARLQ